MSAQSAKLESGQCLLPANAVWLEDFKAELLAFPAGRHDDQVDVLSQFLGWADSRPRITSWPKPIVISRPREFPFDSIYRSFRSEGPEAETTGLLARMERACGLGADGNTSVIALKRLFQHRLVFNAWRVPAIPTK
jgi:hypothetical protein